MTSTDQTRPRGTLRTRVLPVAIAVALAVVASVLIGPRAPQPGPETRGDPALAAAVRDAVGDGTGFDALGVASVAGTQRAAALGCAQERTAFEIGSIAKPLTGMLLADLVDDGVVALDDTLGELLPDLRFADPQLAATTLEQLATHRSGLPRDLPANPLRRFTQTLGSDPFGELTPQDVLDAAARADVGPPEPAYSNFGFAVLGQALAQRTDTPYRDLLRARVLDPLGMDDTVVVTPDEQLPADPGQTEGGTLMSPWRGWGYAPAGSAMWTTAPDLGRLLDAVAHRAAPGFWAADPRADLDDGDRVGLGWVTTSHPTAAGPRTVTWHDGGTSGFRTWAGFDRATGQGAAVLSSTARSVDGVGLRLLGVETDPPRFPWFGVVLTLLLAALAALAVRDAVPGWGRPRVPRDRLQALAAIASAAALLWLTHLLGAWQVVPPAVWAVALAVVAVGVARIVAWWPHLPVTSGPVRRRVWSTVTEFAVTGALLALLAWATA